MSHSTGIRELARLLLLVGGVIALVGGLLGFAGGFLAAGSALAIVVGLVSLVLYRQLGSDEVVIVLLVLGLILAAITGGLASIGGILVSVAALMALVVRYVKV
ncbi:MAG: hypothetical protein OK441_04010 [Thaumarchaeota archaeon]|nr:hypothetical protein [Nitrososphaerota archaeon]